ncbi:MAG: hypothetical protein OWR52_07615 [Acidibacillus sp.]|nr:hypothetical protein [Sulfoacidibacillus ferrooxidans]MCY0893359.1 hypothetical protein [Acidibacillus sp.]
MTKVRRYRRSKKERLNLALRHIDIAEREMRIARRLVASVRNDLRY